MEVLSYFSDRAESFIGVQDYARGIEGDQGVFSEVRHKDKDGWGQFEKLSSRGETGEDIAEVLFLVDQFRGIPGKPIEKYGLHQKGLMTIDRILRASKKPEENAISDSWIMDMHLNWSYRLRICVNKVVF